MGTAVLVHGAWSSPADWRWVAARLHAQDIATAIPDLPSHRDRSAVRADDVAEVQAAIDAAAPPVAVAGWSYGGDVISGLAGTSKAGRLIYVGSYPEPAQASAGSEPPDLDSLPGLLFPDDATVLLDNDWWLGTTLSSRPDSDKSCAPSSATSASPTETTSCPSCAPAPWPRSSRRRS